MRPKFDIDIYIYDIEVFKFDWIITFINYETLEKKIIVNDLEELKNFYEDKIHLKSILVGYNNKWYDDHVLRGILNQADAYNLSQWIVEYKKNPYDYPLLKFKKNNIISFDIMGEMAIGAPVSLKQIEGYLGWRIYECSIPFNIDRKLTKEELDEVIKYNVYDVESTLKIFERFGAKLKTHMALMDFYNIEPRKLNISGASKTAMALKADKIENYKTFKFETPISIRKALDELAENNLYEIFENEIFYTEKEKRKERAFSFEKRIKDFAFTFALGGGHGAIENFHYEGEIWNLDVKSYYVSIMCNFDFVSRALGNDGKKKILDLLRMRIDYKNKGETDLADGLKMMLVAIYGSMAFENSKLWDPKMQTSVCISGQLLLYILCKRLENYAKIIQLNTDGIMIVPYDKDKCEAIYREWEKEFNFELELEVGKRIIQKDVNNYIFQKADIIDFNDKKEIAKKIKVKGMGVRFFNLRMQDEEFSQLANFTINNNYTIVDEAVVKYLLFNVAIEDTIKNCRDLIRFQFILKLMGDFKNIAYKKNDEYIKYEEELKCYRLFAVKDGYDFYKHKIVEDKNSYVRISKSSNNMLILNDDLNKYDFRDIDIDYEHYIKMAQNIVDLYKEKKEEIDSEEIF